MTITIIKGRKKNWGGKETAFSLPVEVRLKIFNLLDGLSLLRSRLVARQWNIFIEEFILGTEEEGRRGRMDGILQQQWAPGYTPLLPSTSLRWLGRNLCWNL